MFFIIAACSHYMGQEESQTKNADNEKLEHLLELVKKNKISPDKVNRERESVTVRDRNSQRALKGVGSPVRQMEFAASKIASSYPQAPTIYIQPNAEKYQKIESNQVTRTSGHPVSTFSIDVDTGSYSNVRRFLNQGIFPLKEAVRLEEMINYFDYQYQSPKDMSTPFAINTAIIQTPWNNQTHLMQVALKGWQQEVSEIPPMNLVFLVDVSGSMRDSNKLPLVVRSLKMLTKHLDKHDRVALVVYAGNSGVVLDSTAGDQKSKIIAALENLQSGGATNGAAGINLAYDIAKENFIKDGVNRVLLATDGDFNVGISNRDQLIALIESKRDIGIYLNTLGFGTGNINDYLMEQLADKGNGQYAYIDTIYEAKKVLVDEIASTMQTIAKDVKIQVEFNPQIVHEYRLLGYENRALNEADFNNDKVDAGEIGAGHTVTALYEISLKNDSFKRFSERRYSLNNDAEKNREVAKYSDEIAWLKFRYKAPDQDNSQLISKVLKTYALNAQKSSNQDIYFAAAVAGFAQLLKDDKYLGKFDLDDIQKIASLNKNFDPYGRKAEFIQLVNKAKTLYLEQTD